MRNPREIELLRLLLPVGTVVALPGILERTGIQASELPYFIESLEHVGFVFDRTEKALCLLDEPKSLVPETIMAGLRTQSIGRDVLVFRETSSTNDRARQAGLSGAAEGLVIFAESQTRGRGTYGRKWISAPGSGLWFSILLRAQIPLGQLPLLVQMAAVACAEVVEQCVEQPVWIKPPNDLILGGGKVAGFLLETSNTWDFQVLGIGINVQLAPRIPGYPTSALEQFSKSRVSRAALAVELLNRFEDWYLRRSVADVLLGFADRASLDRSQNP